MKICKMGQLINFLFFLKTCRKSDPNCPSNVQAGFSILLNLFRQGDKGMDVFDSFAVFDLLHFCHVTCFAMVA